MNNEELTAAREALAAGNIDQARHHLTNARAEGAAPEDVSAVLREIDAAEVTGTRSSSSRMYYAVAIAVIGYLILSIQQPTGWTPVVWFALAFLVIPLLVGALAGNSIFNHTGPPPKAARFWRGFAIAFFTMAIYCFVNLAIARGRVASSDRSSDAAIFCVVALTYAIVAGIIAGIAGALVPAKRRAA